MDNNFLNVYSTQLPATLCSLQMVTSIKKTNNPKQKRRKMAEMVKLDGNKFKCYSLWHGSPTSGEWPSIGPGPVQNQATQPAGECTHIVPFMQAAGVCIHCLRKWSYMCKRALLPLAQNQPPSSSCCHHRSAKPQRLGLLLYDCFLWNLERV